MGKVYWQTELPKALAGSSGLSAEENGGPMTNIDLDALSLPELKQLSKALAKAISEFDGRKRTEARKALEEQAKQLGFSLSELVGIAEPRKRAAAQPKYRHPENAALTWSGRGRKPRWFQDALDAGKSPESLVV
jgi:DNA-binding protein H-NS